MKEATNCVMELTSFLQSRQILPSRLSYSLYKVPVDEGIEIPIIESKDMSYE